MRATEPLPQQNGEMITHSVGKAIFRTEITELLNVVKD
jgi:hypothetical protein